MSAFIDTLAKKVVGWEDDKKRFFHLIIGWFVTAVLGLIGIMLNP